MKLTDALKAHMTKNFAVKADASDDDFRKAVGEALTNDKLDPATFADLTKEKAAGALETLLAKVAKDAVEKATAGMQLKPVEAGAATGLTEAQKKAFTAPNGVKAGAVLANGNAAADSTTTDGVRIEVKKASDKFNSQRVLAKHFRTGQEVHFNNQPIMHPSERQLAMMGAFMKWKLRGVVIKHRGAGSVPPLSEMEKELVAEAFDTEQFAGSQSNPSDVDSYYRDEYGQDGISGHKAFEMMTGRQFEGAAVMKGTALLDESGASGGQGLVPIFYDDQIITYPLLNSELLPYVEIMDVPRGSRMVTGTLANPTLTWGLAEGTSLTMFSTTALASEIDTTIYPVMVAFEIGLDFFSDQVVNAGMRLQQNLGQRFLAEMDKVIAIGNGTTQPQGLTVASGTTSVSALNGIGGPIAVTDAENLMFGLPKQYRNPALKPRYVMNDADYQRMRSVPVSSADQRRVFGMDHSAYSILGYPVSIENDITTGTLIFFAPPKYRLYRRRGWDMREERAGETLALKNCLLLMGRARVGGKVVDAAGVAKCVNAV